MKKITFVLLINFMLIQGCTKKEDYNQSHSNTNNTSAPKHKSMSCSFFQQGIHNVEEFDSLAENNTWPISELSSTARNEFRSKLIFMTTNSTKVVVGFGKLLAYSELGLEKYTELIKVVVGINPDFDDELGVPDNDDNLPTMTCIYGYEPRPELNHYCIKSGGVYCCIPDRFAKINECEGM